jgi:hypothetical protein
LNSARSRTRPSAHRVKEWLPHLLSDRRGREIAIQPLGGEASEALQSRKAEQQIGNNGRAKAKAEAINSLVQAAKAKARGYRSLRNLKAIIYLIAGKLELALPT